MESSRKSNSPVAVIHLPEAEWKDWVHSGDARVDGTIKEKPKQKRLQLR